MTTNAAKKYRVIIIEPSQIVQRGIKTILDDSHEFQLVRCYPDYRSFTDERKPTTPDLLLVNPVLVNFHKQFLVKSFFPDYPDTLLIAILYSYVDPETTGSFDGFIDIYDDATQIIKKLKRTIAHKIEHNHPLDSVDLSDRERDILIAVAQGCTNKEIADRLHISVHTVISHRKNISRKTGIKTVSGLTIYAMFNHLISEEDLV
ncbi:MAG: response regulator transcription factor [Dysgonamonadaceae bacterium]|jgi:DNA-binding NarL/FixJ family response regulator|nr:response regulator transcription factor [Dysgonamonadaceae bacterium]